MAKSTGANPTAAWPALFPLDLGGIAQIGVVGAGQTAAAWPALFSLDLGGIALGPTSSDFCKGYEHITRNFGD
ncbi:hypothetical protein MGYG_08752 [Nannizzia gypsea CBS 118893]|uniref:Uncharacterized protein n=1 Tax=Arthroderma gypseum (strain ATCC MYA-4604 / CBS 118893) TaxID=535722 RepID=E4V6W3_ARTGP|nr:hypothetical protein MGYG_08752 [Nannizzia gypsea CBS 118893]EFQ96829.1 hypothetical protein MGYG_08752 [Nannizzia gypsea CBS 118893]